MLVLHEEAQARAALEGQGVQRDVVRAERRDLLHRVAHIFGRLARQAEDEVHVDVRDAGLAQCVEHRDDVFRRVLAADAVERLCLHRLRVDADARDGKALHRLDLCRRDAVRTARLHREFHDRGPIESIIYHIEHFGKGFVRQARRCAAADVDILHVEAVVVDGFLGREQVFLEDSHELRNALPARQDVRRERAVEAARQAERDADVDTDRLFVRLREEWQLAERHRHDDARLRLAAGVVRLQALDDIFFPHAAADPAVHDLRRAHAMQNAPGCLGHIEFFAEDMVEIELDQAVDRRALALVECSRAAPHKRSGVACEVKEHEIRLDDDAPVLGVGQAVVDDGELQVVGLALAPHDLHLEEHEHLAHDFRDDLLAVIERERPDPQLCVLIHCRHFWASWHSLQRPKNLT